MSATLINVAGMGTRSAAPSGRLRVRYLAAVVWSISGMGFARGATFIASMFTARLLGAEAFGSFAIVQSTAGIAAAVAGAGLGVTASRHMADLRERDPLRAGRILGLSSAVALLCGILLALVTAVGAPFVAVNILHSTALVVPLRIASLLVLFTALNGYQTGALAGLEAFRVMAKVNLWAGMASCPIIIFGAYRGGINGATWGISAAMFVTWALNQVVLRQACTRHGITLTWRNCRSEAHLIYRTSLPVLFSSLIVVPGMWLCNYWIVQQTDGYRQLGVYSAADRYRLLLFVPTAIASSVLPILSNFRGEGDRSGFTRLLRFNALLVFAVVSVPALLFACNARQAMGYLGSSYVAGAPILAVLCLSAIAESLNTALGQAVLIASAWRRFYFDLMLVSIVCGGAFLLVPRLGALGLAIAYLTGFTCTAVALLLWIRQNSLHSKPSAIAGGVRLWRGLADLRVLFDETRKHRT